jgi:phage baseplate assembly protein W
MIGTEPRWGTDLRLLANLTDQVDRDRGSDLFVAPRPGSAEADLEAVTGMDDLRQSLLLRFLTRQGELAALGHPEYGSRLHELIGRLNNEATRNLAKMFALQALAGEPRVKTVVSLTVRAHPSDPTRIDVDASLIPVDSDTPLNLVFPFFVDGGSR